MMMWASYYAWVIFCVQFMCIMYEKIVYSKAMTKEMFLDFHLSLPCPVRVKYCMLKFLASVVWSPSIHVWFVCLGV